MIANHLTIPPIAIRDLHLLKSALSTQILKTESRQPFLIVEYFATCEIHHTHYYSTEWFLWLSEGNYTRSRHVEYPYRTILDIQTLYHKWFALIMIFSVYTRLCMQTNLSIHPIWPLTNMCSQEGSATLTCTATRLHLSIHPIGSFGNDRIFLKTPTAIGLFVAED